MKTPTTVITSGFSYSGSSAVYDFLAGIQDFVQFPGGEFRFFRAPWGLNSLWKELYQTDDISLGSLAKFISFCAGDMPATSFIETNCNRFIKSLRTKYPKLLEKALAVFVQKFFLAKDFPAGPLRKQIFESAFGAFMDSLLTGFACAKGAKYLLLDQATRPWTLYFGEYFPRPKIIMVRRDARDSFVDQFTHAGRPEKEVTAFMERLSMRLKKADRVIKASSKKKEKSILNLQFEEFVKDFENQRGNILDFIGAPDIVKPGVSLSFDPSISIKNIGIHRSNTDLREAITYIEENHPKLLFEESR